jgi:epoxyqueuosine reductase
MRANSDNVKFIKDTAKTIGFDGCGIASPMILEKDIEYLKKWLEENKHGNIKYLEKNIDKKTDPRKLSGNAKSVIALVQSYYPEKKQDENSTFKIARYAYGNDYHVVMKAKAEKFIQTLQKKFKDAEFKIFVDSNTILEKAWAARCGLGWIGKNTLLINQKMGSFMFIGIVLTDIVLDYDEMHQDHCGNCNICMTSCPTHAIEKPYQLNASRCIAYMTIEDSVSEYESQNNTYGWIYGCDICQDICPWNKNIPFTKEKEFIPNPELLSMNKNDWKKLNEKTYNKIFNNSAIKRIGFEKLKKNIEDASNS